ncbi:hypothetical protein HPP92_015550 [Vanilla planifolia]|uniref:WRC domain-containing protein n=1 Tax=Vanilla planifolia TaxID=51239 RepID=A0A835URW8_VANPL|nr:hypothetical protein HPP92_016181 [Vanilla planifolia]KAG0471004.1 hypothetical protein HPP92_015550 [Vanilla planifolia]
MRIRRRPAFLPSLTPLIHPPDLSRTNDRVDDKHQWTEVAEIDKRERERLHQVGDLKIEAIDASSSSNSQCNNRVHSIALDSKRDLDVYLYCGADSSGSPLLKQEFSKLSNARSIGTPPTTVGKRARSSLLRKAKSNGSDGQRMSRPNLLREGSRCSRVNGRGWRCSQPTLVGYSLCEHHLGKGRLKSMSTASRGNAEEKNSNMMEKKKIGMVKEKTISSILRQDKDVAVSPEIATPLPPPLHGSIERVL